MKNQLLVEIKDLRLDFRTFDGISRVLNGVNLKVWRGDVLGLVGETGCGKTMTALSIPRLIPCPPGEITSGQVWFEGEDVLQKTQEEMRLLRAKMAKYDFDKIADRTDCGQKVIELGHSSWLRAFCLPNDKGRRTQLPESSGGCS